MTTEAHTLPNFMIIGAMKCATSTLHEQLAQLTPVFMSTPKEPNFFSDDQNYALGEAQYSELFRGQGDQLKGESSTHYTKFPTYPKTIERMKQYGIDESCKFIYIIREPTQRLVSHYIHEWSQGIIHTNINDALNDHKPLVDYSRYAYQLQHYQESFPNSEVLLVFYENLISQPDAAFSRICSFLGLPSDSQWDHSMEAQNRSSKRIRAFPLYGLLIESAPMKWLRRTLVPQTLRDSIKKKLTMQDRPQLDERSMKHLKELFDKDLLELGGLINMDLSTENYKLEASKTLPIKL